MLDPHAVEALSRAKWPPLVHLTEGGRRHEVLRKDEYRRT